MPHDQNETAARLVSAVLLVGAIVSLGFAGARGVMRAAFSSSFTEGEILDTTWAEYKKYYWQRETGRTIDPKADGVTTSEAQSYTMLRAVWQSDKPVFDRTWQWTRECLQHSSNHLFSWEFGEMPDGRDGVLVASGGANAASDADTDIAFALILASARWSDPTYLAQALEIVRDIWAREVIVVNGTPCLAADDLEKGARDYIVINPSYFAPYAYREFSRIDPEDDWPALIRGSYRLLNRSLTEPLGATATAGLPPDWMRMDRRTGALLPPAAALRASQKTDFGYDALRVCWRIGADYVWNRDPAALALLRRLSFLSDRWRRDGRLAASYRRDGTASAQYETQYETMAMYGAALGYFLSVDPPAAEQVYRTKILPAYDRGGRCWKIQPGYYDDNWTWFGLALLRHRATDSAGIRGSGIQ